MNDIEKKNRFWCSYNALVLLLDYELISKEQFNTIKKSIIGAYGNQLLNLYDYRTKCKSK